ncbi:MAG TPA: hypothetical protein DEH78_12860, partial [Solibacterales bacterium]|nr:hypothetical protein [Bryobacterales bacterium]
QATYEDVNLILRLYEMRREERMRKGRDWFAKNCKPKSMEELMQLIPPGTDDNASFRMVVTYWEMVASFVTSGVLNRDLFFQSGRELVFVYTRLRALIPSIREQYKDPTQMRNLEAVALDFIKWMDTQGPEVYSAFAARIS